ncbi:MAG: DoxX family protein [Vicinamibacteria bacterium]|nr:DoxX family protein [Vicinamibacteria bacterium]
MTTLTATHPSTTDALPVRGLASRALGALLATDADWSATAARVALGAVMLPHGAQKLLGWFGGHGFQGTMGFLTSQVGLPAPLALLIILLESVGAVALVAGVAGRAMAAGIAAIMVGAVATVHYAHGFFMNWGGTQAGEGFEYHILAIGLALVVMLRGSGAGSVDRLLVGRH